MYDLIIIGAGPGGYEASIYASENGLKTLLIEKENLGGVCLNKGCIPTKSLYSLASFIHEANVFKDELNPKIEIDYEKIYLRKEKIISDLQKGIKFKLDKAKVDLIYGEAKFISSNEVIVNDTIYKGKNIIIATGSSNLTNIIPGSENCVSSTHILNQKKLNKSLTIIGGGVIGVEIATILKTFNVDVCIIEKADSILNTLDIDIRRRITTYLKQLGINILTSAQVTSITKESNFKVVNYIKNEVSLSIQSEEVLLSIGRKLNLNLDLEKAFIEYSSKGIKVNENFQTNITNIYAIGDCTGQVLLAHYATSSGIKAIDHILGKVNNTNFNLTPSVIFTLPEIASVGLTEEEAKKMGLDYTVNKVMYRSNGMANATSKVDGFIKVIISMDYLIGVSIIGYSASTLIHEACIIMNSKLKISEVRNYIFAHPTISEVFKESLNY